MHHRIWVTVAIVLAAGVGICVRAADPAPARQPSDSPLRIGVVNAGKVFDKMTEIKEAMASLQQKADNFAAEQHKGQEEVQNLDAQSRQLKVDSPQWLDVRSRVEQKSVALKVQGELFNVEIQRAQKTAFKTAHEHVIEATQKIAQSRHLNLAIADSDPDLSSVQLEQYNGPQFRLLLASRTVYYADANVDITEPVPVSRPRQIPAAGLAPA